MAQQDPLYSQYMFNGLVLNPAYAGSRESASLTLIARRQWTGLDGAPSTGSLSFHSPSRNDRNGYGFTFVYDQFTPVRRMDFRGSYALRIPLGKSWLSVGVQGGFDQIKADFNTVSVKNPNDPAFSGNVFNILRPAAGTGIYFRSDNVYAGFSVPNVIPYSLHPKVAETLESRRYTHYLLTGGLVLPLGSAVKFKPSFLARMVAGAPVSLDLNGSFLFAEKLWIGGSWRMKDALVGILELNITPQLRLGYAYDYSISGLGSYQRGGHEFMLGFDFGVEKDRMLSPRNF